MINEYVIFKVADEHYGVEIEYVENIEKHSVITHVPFTKDYIHGIINLRGEIIAVINVRKRLGIEYIEPSKDSRIMIIKYKDINVGLLVDYSSEVLQIDSEFIETAPKSIGEESDYIKSVAKHDGRIIMIVELDKFLEIEQQEE